MARKKRMYYVGFCRICGTGPLGLRRCGGCDSVVVLCDECDAAWPDADFSAKPTFATEDGMPCPHCESSLIDAPSRWATKKQIEDTAWVQEAVDAGEIEVQRGSALAPDIDEEE